MVGLISPNKKALDQLVNKLGKEEKLVTLKNKCDDDDIEQEVYDDLNKVGKEAGLGKKEIPVRIRMVPDEWSPDNGILTAALKLKRKTIEINYQKELDNLYITTTTNNNNNNKNVPNNNNETSSKHFDQNNNDMTINKINGTNNSLHSRSSNEVNSNGKQLKAMMNSV